MLFIVVLPRFFFILTCLKVNLKRDFSDILVFLLLLFFKYRNPNEPKQNRKPKNWSLNQILEKVTSKTQSKKRLWPDQMMLFLFYLQNILEFLWVSLWSKSPVARASRFLDLHWNPKTGWILKIHSEDNRVLVVFFNMFL